MPILYTAAGLVALAIALFVWTLLSGPDRRAEQLRTNLQRNLDRTVVGAESGPAGPAEQPESATEALARRLTPKPSIKGLEGLITKAGRPAAWPLRRVLVAKLVLMLVAALLSLLFLLHSTTPLGILGALVVTVVAYFVPDLLLYSRGIERREAITLGLADALDQMTIAVEAGLGFEAAMARVSKNGRGPLAEEFARTLQDVQVGQSRRAAYEALAERASVPDLRRFIRTIIQAEGYGVSVGDVLRTQAAQMRLKRRQRAEQKAMQVPVKVIFPLMLCILPVLFITLLGPAVMDIVKVFS